LGWFSAVGKLIGSFGKVAQSKADDLVLGSRAADVAEEQAEAGMDWDVEETEASALIPQARQSIDAGKYADALATLAKADAPAEPAMAWDLWFWKGDCFFQLEDYGDAAASLSSANELSGKSKVALGTSETRALLLFQLGSSWFLLGKNDAAIPLLGAYTDQNPDGPYAPYATLLLSRAVAATGDTVRSRSIATAGARTYAGRGLDAEFAALTR
jgi:tetratricopeptide (TPR) repeat protein